VDSAELKLLTSGLFIEADPLAGSEFRTAAVRLDETELDNDSRAVVAADAARFLVGLALGGGAGELAELLIADPAVSINTWTVACYEIGGLTPVSVREFDDAGEAVVTVSMCSDEAHVAAELVASNDDGLRWTAMWRTDDHVSFQLPTLDTAEADERLDEHAVGHDPLGALNRWRIRLAEWSGREASPAPLPPTTASNPAPPAVLLSPTATRFQALEQRLNGIESTLDELKSELQAFAVDTEQREDASSAAVEHAIDIRFQVLARLMHSALDRLSAQLVDDVQQVARATAQSTRDIEAALREETGTVLMGVRAGLSPLTDGLIERISIIEAQTRAKDHEAVNVFDMRS